jgi:RNA polymerase sigma-70 factor (ECF subfamily)
VAAVILDHNLEVDPVVTPADELKPLVARARVGDRRALEDLLSASYDHVYPVCRRVLGNEADAADAAQEALISVVRGLPRFDGRSRFSTWLYRIAMNAAIDELRRRGRRPIAPFPPAERTGGGPSGVGADEAVGMIDVEVALRALPLEFRAAVVLRDVCGMDYAEIAEVLSIPGGTVRSRIARGRSLLAQRLGPAMEASP